MLSLNNILRNNEHILLICCLAQLTCINAWPGSQFSRIIAWPRNTKNLMFNVWGQILTLFHVPLQFKLNCHAVIINLHRKSSIISTHSTKRKFPAPNGLIKFQSTTFNLHATNYQPIKVIVSDENCRLNEHYKLT